MKELIVLIDVLDLIIFTINGIVIHQFLFIDLVLIILIKILFYKKD